MDDAPKELLTQLTKLQDPETRALRQLVWGFVRNVDTGLPRATLLADTEWHPLLLARTRLLLSALEKRFGFTPAGSLGQRLAKKGLPHAALMQVDDLAAERLKRMRVGTVHEAKGESLDAVLYIASKDHVQAMLAGVQNELGRIGYVAVTRAKDLFWLGVPANAIDELRADLVGKGFQEIGVNGMVAD